MVVPSTSTPHNAFSPLNRGFSSYSHGSRPPDAHWHPTEVSRTLEIYNVLLHAHADDEEELEVIREVDPIWAVFGEHRSRSAVWDGQETIPNYLRGSRGPRMGTDHRDRARYEEAVDDCIIERLRIAIGRTRVALQSRRQLGAARDIRSREMYNAGRYNGDDTFTMTGVNRRYYTPVAHGTTERSIGLPTPSSRRNVSTTPHGVAADSGRHTANDSQNLHNEDVVRYRTPEGACVLHPAEQVPPTPMSQDDIVRRGGRASELQLQPRRSLSRGEGNVPSIGWAQYDNRVGRGGMLSAIQEADDHLIVGEAQVRGSNESTAAGLAVEHDTRYGPRTSADGHASIDAASGSRVRRGQGRSSLLEVRKGGTIVPRVWHGANAPHMPTIAGKESVIRRNVRGNRDAPGPGVDQLRAPGSAPSENPIPSSRSQARLQAREARESGTIVPQAHNAQPTVVDDGYVSRRKESASDDAPLTGIHRLRAPESAPINPGPLSEPPAAAREGEGPKGTSNDVGELTAIDASAIARVSESINDSAERSRRRERDTHNADALSRAVDCVGRSCANADDSCRERRDAGTARDTSSNEYNNSLAYDDRTVVRTPHAVPLIH
ncbi:hypothetical protein PLICRDRAFT_179737 [Plicaturopsis crispa FD-325 SS-3]|uniref:Uncharacterized protein n=1 Tax=Plicaturopsis crispa FD-325 SS-3 TaxID=944288 RepID=A0A0C9T3Z7_PLICR|nr:hypothetical protein PLICRDRAFT_179737 [Plicaturopsis crispa FD-325 SS-3]